MSGGRRGEQDLGVGQPPGEMSEQCPASTLLHCSPRPQGKRSVTKFSNALLGTGCHTAGK